MSEQQAGQQSQTVAEALVAAVRRSARYNPDVESAPHCILWTDREQQWQSVIPALQGDMPELLVFGEYEPERRRGPAIWLRCAMAGTLDEITLPPGQTPVIYLPGVGRQDLRAVESCPESLKPLAELQYRGVTSAQINTKDWTVLAFLKSEQGGLGLDVAQDQDSKRAMLLALSNLIDEDVALLRDKRLDANYFNTLLTGGDPTRDLLQWLEDPEAFDAARTDQEKAAFAEVCRSQFAFNVQDGPLAAADLLAKGQGPWANVWQRFCESARRYPNIPKQIRRCQAPAFDLGDDAQTMGGWPQWNDHEEEELQKGLLALQQKAPHQAREQILSLDRQHAQRRNLVWAELGEAPLACALQHLATLASVTGDSLAAGSLDDLAAAYASQGWRADDAVMRALEHASSNPDYEAITAAVRAVYLPWSEDAARYLQKIVSQVTPPGGTREDDPPPYICKDQCVLFVDGLRFDTGKRLTERLESAGFEVEEDPTWTALPSVTATGKAAVSPVRDQITGAPGSTDFEPNVRESKVRLNSYHLRKLLGQAGWEYLKGHETGAGQGQAWCEFGDIDHEGHSRGWKLAMHLDGMLDEIRERIEELLAAGWAEVRVVTDHGWLLMPGGLPKIELPSALAETKWGRCAAIKQGAKTVERLFPWYWDPHQEFALADGIACYKRGEDYAHGGLSLQECLTLQLAVRHGTQSHTAATISDVGWKGLRCTVAVEGGAEGWKADIRQRAGDSASSIVNAVRPFKENGTCSMLVEDDSLEGQTATLVILDEDGQLLQQRDVVIGGT
ncbi:PglZ domain protein [Thioalkalivibrio sp. K90mix]|jgi:hypothetical protein|uniref:BREX-1 system phosphatase PglZ type B n=1 Tax=Thioalkalivibrio sp. (strain K90mix) TaxID=396595 RepID=UPI000195A3A4|nr:BREX-1 system phosphatase PglZ type B [Thioalkalivibrio sp. K90mix]ADC71645.1 PglZ domain protein [Thioalkalivibrio sp. K90mix]